MASTEDRLAALEERVAALEDAGTRRDSTGAGTPEEEASGETDGPIADPDGPGHPGSGGSRSGDFWMLDGLSERVPAGAVGFAGHLETPGGPVRWQWARATGELLTQDWSAAAPALAALGHPVRLRLVQLVLTGVATTAELAAADEFGTTGQLHHHLRVLVAAGWLRTTGRGHYEVPAPRVVPLLTILTAAD